MKGRENRKKFYERGNTIRTILWKVGKIIWEAGKRRKEPAGVRGEHYGAPVSLAF